MELNKKIRNQLGFNKSNITQIEKEEKFLTDCNDTVIYHDNPNYFESNATENKFLKRLIDELCNTPINSKFFTGDISHNECLVIPTKVFTPEELQIYPALQNNKKAKYILRRPDFIIHKYQIIIEIDGPIHDCLLHRIKADNSRDLIYKKLGLSVYRVSADQVSSPKSLNRVIKEILELCSEQDYKPDIKKYYQSVRKKISRYRKNCIKDIHQLAQKKNSIGKYDKRAQNLKHYDRSNMTSKKQYGGIRYSFHPKTRIKK